MEAIINQQVAVINNSIEIFRSAPEILQSNQARTAKAISVGNNIIDQWHAAWAIESEEERLAALAVVDERSNKYLVNCNTALKEEKEARAAITQMMDAFKKMFTEAENELDRTKPNTITNKVQNNRDTYVSEVAKVQERKRREAERVAAKAKEEIEIRSSVEKWLSDKLIGLLTARKEAIQNAFNHIVLETFEEKAERIEQMSVVLPGEELQEKVMSASPTFSNARYHDQAEREAISNAVLASFDFNTWSLDNWTPAMSSIKEDLISKLPAKKAELLERKRLDEEAAEARRRAEEALKKEKDEAKRKEIEAQAARAEAQRAEAERKQAEREAEDNARIAREAEEAKQKAEQEAEIRKQGEQTMVMFEQEAAIAEVAPSPEARQGYELTILHPVGFTQVFALWFENEGKNLPVDKIGNTKLDQMKAWAEKYAHKTGTKIESKFLKYEESYKAVNRKAK